jgi:hypothetical protein
MVDPAERCDEVCVQDPLPGGCSPVAGVGDTPDCPDGIVIAPLPGLNPYDL